MISSLCGYLQGAADLLYPPRCVICGTFGSNYICPSCLQYIECIPRPYCLRCGHPIHGKHCLNCWGRVQSFTAARALGIHEGVLRQAIHAFKYNGARMLADPLARLLHKYLTTRCDIPWRCADWIVPVPIHPARFRLRGYNQSELLACCLSHITGMPVLSNAISRVRYTRPQVELSGPQRRENVKAAFRVTRLEAVRGKKLLVVDDVATTTSTLHECSLALSHSGASRIYTLCLAFGV